MERPANAGFEKISQHFFSLASGTSQGWDQLFQFDLGGEVAMILGNCKVFLVFLIAIKEVGQVGLLLEVGEVGVIGVIVI